MLPEATVHKQTLSDEHSLSIISVSCAMSTAYLMSSVTIRLSISPILL